MVLSLMWPRPVGARSYEEHRLLLWPAAKVVEMLNACGFGVMVLAGYGGAPMPPSAHEARLI